MKSEAFIRIVQGSFGGAYLGIIVTHIPRILGYDYSPTQNAEIVASLIGLSLAGVVCIRENVRRRQAKASKD